MTTISAKSILASVHALDATKRLDTLLLRYPRCIHSEFMTHRMFSRNASSSRAIPVEKLIQDVLDDPFVPLFWGLNQKGMQAHEELGEFEKETAIQRWNLAKQDAIRHARWMAQSSVHKQIVNRLLEPFSHINVLVTSTNWSNFLALRDHKDAEPHIQILAKEIRKALEEAEVKVLQPGQWHLPFITGDEFMLQVPARGRAPLNIAEHLIKLSVARCASTSYKTVEGFDMTLEVAERIWEKLFTSPIHASPFEHVAQADEVQLWKTGTKGDTDPYWFNEELGGNLGPGWIQLRKTLEGECL